MRTLLLALALAAPFAAADAAGIEPGRALPPQAGAQAATPDATLALFPDERLYKSCRRKVRRAYGWVRGRHSMDMRIAYIEMCVAAGGRVV